MAAGETLRKYARLTKIEHALFALPFSTASMLYAADGWPPAPVVGWILVALLAGRAFGMACNRIIDRRVDAKNPRTADRLLPRGELGIAQAKLFAAGCAAVLAFATWRLNPLCLRLLPVAGALLVGYSYAKFYTPACHLILGMTLGSAAGGAWVAVTGAVTPPIWFLFAGVTFWAAGFDIIYACQDIEVDRRLGLHSVPAALGRRGAMDVAAASHALALTALAGFGWARGCGAAYPVGMTAIAALVVGQHAWARRRGDAVVQQTFFYANAGISLLFLATAVAEVFGP